MRQKGSHDFGSAPSLIMEPPEVVLPDGEVFARRAVRLRDLVIRVPALDEYLSFMARVVQAQHLALSERKPAWQPPADAFDAALEHGLPPLGHTALRRDLDWRADLQAILESLDLHAGQRQRPLLQQLRQLPESTLEALAERALDGRAAEPALRGLQPLVAAALQVSWVRLAVNLPRPPARLFGEARTLCPCCGAEAVVSVVHNEQHRSGVRYLHCGLCSSQWHLERLRCSLCGEGAKLRYLTLDDEHGKPYLPVQAEACGDCHGYRKLIARDQDGHAEPLADDLASLALDLALGEGGEYARGGLNPLLVMGD
jgi:FdhE protein